MNLTFAAQLNKMITAGLGGSVEAPETGVAVGRRVEYTSIGPAPLLTFEANSELPLKALSINMEPIQEGSGDPSPENVRPISGRSEVNVWREATYDTSAEPAFTIQLGQTVYGGTVDAVSGVLTVDWAMVDLGTLSWSVTTGTSSNKRFFSNTMQNSIKPTPTNSIVSNGICSVYKMVSANSGYSGQAGVCITIDVNSTVSVYDEGYESASAFKTAMNGVQLCCELATPVTVQLTAQQLTTLLGTNNVWSDGGDVSLTYGTVRYTEGY